MAATHSMENSEGKKGAVRQTEIHLQLKQWRRAYSDMQSNGEGALVNFLGKVEVELNARCGVQKSTSFGKRAQTTRAAEDSESERSAMIHLRFMSSSFVMAKVSFQAINLHPSFVHSTMVTCINPTFHPCIAVQRATNELVVFTRGVGWVVTVVYPRTAQGYCITPEGFVHWLEQCGLTFESCSSKPAKLVDSRNVLLSCDGNDLAVLVSLTGRVPEKSVNYRSRSEQSPWSHVEASHVLPVALQAIGYLVFLVMTVACFSAGLMLFTYTTTQIRILILLQVVYLRCNGYDQGSVTSTITTVFTTVPSFGLAAVSAWFASERWIFVQHHGLMRARSGFLFLATSMQVTVGLVILLTEAKLDKEMVKIPPRRSVIDIDKKSSRLLQSHVKAPFMTTFQVRKERFTALAHAYSVLFAPLP
ncbi:uncharacterized protein F5147DRAFT_657346 [Suillus discolor]|uniref:Uncharacterized protein n=1 Tax=Suillus discolor TaxID=1912936 RepID=A0A9P7EW44_9AGAM|nr:uncharacterized protein F5147DRAFT_657346 [Suillus discolor]KAG2093724.1 hypothetical protein F5147DRAFT_657346 [Suillus discolor]